MKVTNYSEIADKYDKYDNNKFRHEIKPDADLVEYINKSTYTSYSVLDLACGTGIYLYNQMKYLDNMNIEWHGLDASIDMLNVAGNKVKNVMLKRGMAEELDYETKCFDFISNNYAFHHFQGKEKALDEISRVIKQKGIFKMHNIAIHDMPKWWIYQLFPNAYYEDLKRFWQKEVIFNELSQRGFDVRVHIEYKMQCLKLSSLMDHIYNRDISVLTIISNEEYSKGLEMAEYRLRKDSEAEIVNDFAEMFIVATIK